MGRVDDYQLYQLPGFPAGFVRNSDSSRLLQTESYRAENFRLDARGELVYRSGYEQYSNPNPSLVVEWLYPWRASNGLEYMIAIDSLGDIWWNAGSQPVYSQASFTDSGEEIGLPGIWTDFGVTFASAGDKMFISSLTATAVVTFDGTTWGTSATVPTAKNLLYRHERLFAGNFIPYAQRIVFSSIGVGGGPEVFDPLDFLDVNPQDGQPIMKMIEFGDSIIIFKTKSIWQLNGRTPATFNLYELDNQRGSISPNSVVVHNGILYFLDRDTGVWAFDGAQFTLISNPINEYLLESATYDNAYTASAYSTKEQRYYLSFDTGESEEC